MPAPTRLFPRGSCRRPSKRLQIRRRKRRPSPPAPETAVDIAARALARRDRCEADVRRILAAKGVHDAEIDDALQTLRRSGVVDDERFARGTAAALASRGFGDEAIRFRLEREGVASELAVEALGTLQPEAQRAALLAERRNHGPKLVRWLAARGFSPESVEHALASVARTDVAELG